MRQPTHRGVFVTGTDTGVGKTRVAVALGQLLVERGLTVRPRKPTESGCPRKDGGLVPQDAWALKIAAAAPEPIETVCPYPFQPAVAPDRAARLAGYPLDLAALAQACWAGNDGTDFLLVEGAGGFYSPLAEDALNADLAVMLGLPVLLVAADRLGCINHILLCVEAIRRHGLPLAGVVLNQLAPGMDQDMDNAADLARWLDSALYRLPYRGANESFSELTPLAERLANSTASSHHS